MRLRLCRSRGDRGRAGGRSQPARRRCAPGPGRDRVRGGRAGDGRRGLDAKVSPRVRQDSGNARARSSSRPNSRLDNTEAVMTTFAVIAEHPPELCPSSNAQTREMMNEGAGQIAQLAERLGVTIVTLRVFGPDHIILA